MTQEKAPLPEWDPTKDKSEQGLFRKFIVTRVDGSDQPGGKHHGCEYYVLDLDHDPHAVAALRAYAKACRSTLPLLADDIEARFGKDEPVAQLHAVPNDRPYADGKTYFDVAIFNRDACYDGMDLYAAPGSSPE